MKEKRYNKYEKINERSMNNFQLLSIHRVSKILKIRHDSVQNLISSGSLKAIKIKKRFKVPLINLKEFVRNNTEEKKNENETTLTNTQQKIDTLINEFLN